MLPSDTQRFRTTSTGFTETSPTTQCKIKNIKWLRVAEVCKSLFTSPKLQFVFFNSSFIVEQTKLSFSKLCKHFENLWYENFFILDNFLIFLFYWSNIEHSQLTEIYFSMLIRTFQTQVNPCTNHQWHQCQECLTNLNEPNTFRKSDATASK